MPRYTGLSETDAARYRAGAPDAYGNAPEQATSDGAGVPCRRCLRIVPKGRGYLILAHRPFAALQPYAETGPIFLCADACAPDGAALPEVLTVSPDYLLKGYSDDERIVYGTGQVVSAADLEHYAETLLARDGISFVDVRSARNNCWQVRIFRD